MGMFDAFDDWIDENIGRWFRKTVIDQGGHLITGVLFASAAWFALGSPLAAFGIGLGCSFAAGTAWELVQNWGDPWDHRSGLRRTLFKLGPVPVNGDFIIDWFFRVAGGAVPGIVALAI